MFPLRYLIINADDFGYNDAITQGILKGYREGLVTSTTAMVNIKGAVERIIAAKTENPELPIGLHLNITSGCPVLPASSVPHLVRPDGTFYPFEDLLLLLPVIPIQEVRAELIAQAETLSEAGIIFDHIDYHQQVLALYTPIFEIVGELATAYQVPVRQPSLAHVRGKPQARRQNQVSMILRFLLRAFLRHPNQALRLINQVLRTTERKNIAGRVGTTDWFVGAFFDHPTLDNFCAILHQLPPGVSEIMAHPALDRPDLNSMSEGYRAQRIRELVVLTDPVARNVMGRLGIRLICFSRGNLLAAKMSLSQWKGQE